MSRFLGMAAAMLALAVAVSSPAYAQTLYGSWLEQFWINPEPPYQTSPSL